MATKYPILIDDNLSLPKVIDLVSPIMAKDVNQLQEAIIAIQKELGTNPSGTESTVKDRINNAFDNLFASNVIVFDLDGYFVAGPDGYTSVEEALAQLAADIEGIKSGQLTASNIPIDDVDGYYASGNVEGALAEIGEDLFSILSGGGVAIGEAEDGDYTDGLFTDFTPNTLVGTATDRFNEVLKSLAPSPAPSLSEMDLTTAGVAGNLSFGVTNGIIGYTDVGTIGGGPAALDIDDLFPVSGVRQGIFAAGGTRTGTIASNVSVGPGTPNPAYPANAFGDADQGTLELWVNGALVHSTDLATFGSGSDFTGGSGFTLSASTDASFPNGDPFEIFQHRTGTWTVASAHEQNGWNYVQIVHDLGATQNTTNYIEWIVDDNVTATNFPNVNEFVTNLTMVSTSKYISGVEYHTSGTLDYDVQIENIHRNTYSDSSSAVSFTNSTNINTSGTGESLGPIAGPGEGANKTISGKVLNLAGDVNNRILNGSAIVVARADRTVQADSNSPNAPAISGILLDTNSDNSTDTNHTLNGEKYRVPSNRSLSDTSGFVTGGASFWASTNNIISGGSGYNNGLLMYDGGIVYPSDSQVALSGNFGGIVNGPGNSGQPGGPNPNYSGAAGTRFFWTYFFFPNPASVKNFTLAVQNTGTSFVTVGSGLTATNVYCEILLPSQTTGNGTDGNGSPVVSGDCFKDCRAAFTDDNGAGALNGTFNETNWPLTTGTKTTALSGNAAIIRITAGATWTGKITNISLVSA